MRKYVAFTLLFLLFLGCAAPSQEPELTPDSPETVSAPAPPPSQPPLPPQDQPAPELPAVPEEEPIPPEMPSEEFEEVTPGEGIGNAPAGLQGDNGPWKHRIKSASSPDGLQWTRDNFILADQASVPDAIIDTDGDIRVYYVDWKNGGISVAINKDGDWRYYKVKVEYNDFFSGADPDVVLIDDVYRLYFTNFESVSSRFASIDVAFSDNGIEFEDQETAYAREQGITDPDVFMADDEWVMLISEGVQSTLATSDDGLDFRKQSELPFMGSVSNTIKVAGGYRMYYHKSSGLPPQADIYSAFSSDGLDWEEEGLRLEASASEESVESPAVVRLPDGGYRMFYHSMISD